jgi:hypothetical protein
MLTEKLIAKVTTDCLCGEYFDEELEQYVPVEECSGDCYEWQKEDVFTLLGEWQLAHGIEEDDPILINGESMGWQHRSGFKWTTMLQLDGALALGGDFRIEWYLENGELTARRWSHDEPTGTGLFTFSHYRECDKCNTPIKADIHTEELGMCVECSHAYFNHEGE